jgi:hypothetical protein
MTTKPLTAKQARELIETFKKNQRDVVIYNVSELGEPQRRALLKSDGAWIVVELVRRKN